MSMTYRALSAVVIVTFVGTLSVAVTRASQGQGNPPSAGEVAFAQQVSDLLLNELVAALFQEFNETTPENVEHGKQAISLIFNDLNRDIRLVGTFRPLGGENALPEGSFEKQALERAVTGESHTAVQKVANTWYYRRSIPLSNTLHTACVLCHTNFTPEFFTNNPGQWVGMLALRVPITN